MIEIKDMKGIDALIIYKHYLTMKLVLPDTLNKLLDEETPDKADLFNSLLIQTPLNKTMLYEFLRLVKINNISVLESTAQNFKVEELLEGFALTLKKCSEIKPTVFF